MLNIETLKKQLENIEAVLPLVQHMTEKGKSQYDIAVLLREKGVARSNGKPWNPWCVSRLLEANKGAH